MNFNQVQEKCILNNNLGHFSPIRVNRSRIHIYYYFALPCYNRLRVPIFSACTDNIVETISNILVPFLETVHSEYFKNENRPWFIVLRTCFYIQIFAPEIEG
jgi:hypothetical protein